MRHSLGERKEVTWLLRCSSHGADGRWVGRSLGQQWKEGGARQKGALPPSAVRPERRHSARATDTVITYRVRVFFGALLDILPAVPRRRDARPAVSDADRLSQRTKRTRETFPSRRWHRFTQWPRSSASWWAHARFVSCVQSSCVHCAVRLRHLIVSMMCAIGLERA